MKTLQQKYKGTPALYTAKKYGVDIVDTGGTWSGFKDFVVVCRKGGRVEVSKIKWQDDGLAFLEVFGEKIYLKDFIYKF